MCLVVMSIPIMTLRRSRSAPAGRSLRRGEFTAGEPVEVPLDFRHEAVAHQRPNKPSRHAVATRPRSVGTNQRCCGIAYCRNAGCPRADADEKPWNPKIWAGGYPNRFRRRKKEMVPSASQAHDSAAN